MAAISVSATLVIGGGLVKDIVVPAYTEQLKNQLVEFPRVKEQNEKLQLEIKELTSQLAAARSETSLALTANTFVQGDPYPVGLNSVRIGDPISKIDRTYHAGHITKEKKSPYWSVRTGHPVFRTVTYYFDPDSKNPTVNTLLLFVETDKYPNPYLKKKLLSVLGEAQGSDDEDEPFWLKNGVLVRLNADTYTISRPHPYVLKKLKAK